MKKKSNIIFVGILFLAFALMAVILVLIYKEINNNVLHGENTGEFSINFIRKSNENIGRKNYMISPYSVEMALSMVRDGASGTTYDEINRVVPSRNIKNLSVKERVNVANGLFVKDKYKSYVKDNFVNIIKKNYNSDVYYDEFVLPDRINDWVKINTNGMITKVFDRLSNNFVLAIVNAVAMEEEWESKFECNNTSRDKFNLVNGSSMDVSMMYKSFDGYVSYYEDKNIKSVVMPYKMYNCENGSEVRNGGEQLEFIGILPNEDANEYVNKIDFNMIKKIESEKKNSSSNFLINVSIPKFKFDYDFSGFKNTLMDLGIKNAFNASADFSNILKEKEDFYIGDAVHKSFVQFDEDGTKAAAVTGFSFEDNMVLAGDSVDIVFDKPFIFLIKDVKSDEILFFGVVYEPSEYEENICE